MTTWTGYRRLLRCLMDSFTTHCFKAEYQNKDNSFKQRIYRGRHQKRYSVIAITLCYVLELSHNASTLCRKVIASFSYRSGLIEIVISSYSYCSNLIAIIIASYTYRSKVTKSLLHLTTMPGFPPSWVDLTCITRLRAQDMGEVVLV